MFIHKFIFRFGHDKWGLSLFILAFALAGCWSKEVPPATAPNLATPTSPYPAPMARAATPTSPVPQPNTQTVSTPKPTPKKNLPKAVSLAELTGKANPLSLENMTRVHVGMPLDQVNRSLGKDGEIFSSDNVGSEIYRWSDGSGASIVAKFENGKLVRKSIIAPESDTTQDISDSEDTLLNMAQYEKVQTGMSLSEIQAMLGVEPRIISDYDAKVTMYEWVDKKGSNFFARFDNGRMTRKTGFHVAAMKEESKIEEITDEPEDDSLPEKEEPQEFVSNPVPEETTELTDNTPAPEPDSLEDTIPAALPRSKVAVVGSNRDMEERSYHPMAKFPEYTWQFRRGNYEVRVKNTADTEVKVGLRAGKFGKDINIAPGRSASIEVDQGTYTLYYQYGDEPDNVYTGQPFNIDGMLVTDVEVQVFNEDYGIGNLNRAYE